jgi:hypothetical protein
VSFVISTSPVAEIAVSLLYSVLSYTAVLVLFASAISLLIFIARIIIREIRVLIGATDEARSSVAEPRVKTLNPVGIAVGSRGRQIRGAHNDRF